MYALRLPLILLVLTASATPAGAQSVRSKFLSMFATKIQQVGRTPSTDDNVALVQEMLETAKKATAEPELLSMIADRAYQLAQSDPRAYQAGIEVMRLEAAHVPARQIEALTAAAALQQRRVMVEPDARAGMAGEMLEVMLQLGDGYADQQLWDAALAYYTQAAELAQEINSPDAAKIAAAIQRVAVRQQVKKLSARIARDPTDRAAADELMKLYLIELDDPAAAAKYQFTANDELLKRQVSLATRELETLNATQSLTLGDWYRELMKVASPAALPQMQQRAASYYKRYLNLYKYEDAERQRVIAALQTLDSVAERLAQAPPEVPATPPEVVPEPPAVAVVEQPRMQRDPAPAAPVAPEIEPPAPAAPAPPAVAPLPLDEEGWVNLYGNIVVATDTGRGIWKYEDGVLKGEPPTPAQFTLPTAPAGDYVLEVQFKRTSNIGSIAFHLPVGEHRVLATLGERRRRERDHIAGLATIGGEPAESNPTTTKFELKTDQVYTARVEVITEGFDTKITVSVDGQPLFSWKGAASSLDVSKAWARFDPKAFGVGIDGAGTAEFLAARLKGVGNEPKPLR